MSERRQPAREEAWNDGYSAGYADAEQQRDREEQAQQGELLVSEPQFVRLDANNFVRIDTITAIEFKRVSSEGGRWPKGHEFAMVWHAASGTDTWTTFDPASIAALKALVGATE